MTGDRRSDAELIAAVRRGDSEAYGELYERHLHAAKRAASCLSKTAAEREDLVADAFTRVLRVLRDGGGPTEEFRAYLLVTLRNAAISGARGATVSLYADVPEVYLPQPGGDPVLHQWDANAAASAFASLPERWRTVLWHTEVEDESPAEIAPLLGLRPNGVAALAYRAREGLRQAYLRAHLTEVEGRECQATVSKLAGWVRSSVPDPLSRKISKHLARCAECRVRADTLAKANAELRSSVAPLLLGASLAAGYLPAAAPVTVAKTLVAKAAAIVVIAATAVTTVASSPRVAACDPLAQVPALADPTSATETIIHGPVSFARPTAGAPSTGEPAVDGGGGAMPAGTEVPATSVPATSVPSAVPSPPRASVAEERIAAKEERKAEKEAAKSARKEAKEQAKAEKKAEKDAEKDDKGK
ncbi:sigma-70 family RNA polymerase sigma factor [Actinophytocola algeriensis]|uniref:RNA polymerase sigma factor (Sigma-70 family) n=1 Tax=Actinophytocola algeriensis TaxID=1768010 RepID=A0A7W7VEW4_9PSEU|nr:sigma-70 family RNA polymerase sigma factor [Actinophytocola algeriensis]MBB4907681.1 RNA polymerase sigma factor (sigma-70 family) [Actinophytocola algeriensis]MBE1479711.1 RNA polymerase sigma factor (sigma-70 family) [Actinophytocola algeriensis]